MIFGKKPVLRGAGDREGERERDRGVGSARETQESAERRKECRVYVLERNHEGNRVETRLPGRGGLKSSGLFKSVRSGSLAGFGRLE